MNLLKKKNSGTSLFKHHKNTPEFLVKQTKLRQSITRALSRAIKEIQLQFASQDPSSEGTGFIGDGRSSQHVCTAFEEMLKHGLKPGWFGQGTPTFWPVVLKISRKQATEYIGTLQHAQSDSAKCRGWIRLAVNECSLASYLTVLCQDNALLSSFYEPHSFVRDPETVSTLTDLLAGLSLIPFKLTVDVASLEFDSVPEAHSDLPIRMNTNSIPGRDSSESSSAVVQKKTTSGDARKKRRTKQRGDRDTLGTQEMSGTPIYGGSTPIGSTPSGSNLSLDRQPLHSGSTSDLSSCDRARGDNVSENLSIDELAEDGCGLGVAEDEGSPGGSEGLESWNENSAVLERNEDSLELEYEYSDDGGTEWDYWKKATENEQEPNEWNETVDVETTLIDQSIGKPLSLTNLAEEVIGQEDDMPVEFTASGQESPSQDRESPLHDRESLYLSKGSPYQDRGSPYQERRSPYQDQGNPYQSRGSPSLSFSDQDKYDARTGSLESECKERQDTLVGEVQDTLPLLNSLSTLTNSFALHPSPVNPFDGATPSTQEESTIKGHGTNPFLSDIPPTNPFFGGSSQLSDDQRVNPSTNPFQSKPNTSATIFSYNPFDTEDHDVLSHRTPSPPPPPSLSLPSSSSSSSLPPSSSPLSPHTFNWSPPPTLHSDLSPPLAHLHPFPSHPHPTISSPVSSPPDSPLTGPPRGGRPGSASSSASSLPPRSQGTDELESYSNSSIDISFMDAVPFSSEHSTASYLGSPDENYFQPEMSAVDVQLALDRLKVELVYSEQDDSQKDDTRKKIVELQMKLQNLKDEEEEDQFRDSSVKEVYGHQLVRQRRRTGIMYRVCECCGKRIRGLLHAWYMCKLCGFAYHKKCLGCVERVCSAGKPSTCEVDDEAQNYVLEVCPEKGLTQQQFRCALCNVALNCTTTLTRLCDYCGLYFCPNCHHNDAAVIPARVIHNWDFNPKKVCCKCCDYLERFSTKPMLRVQPINSLLYTYVQDLTTIETLRRDFLVMKKYFMQCPNAKETQLLKKLDDFPHFKDGAKRFSLADLKAVHNGSLLPQLSIIHREFSSHIKRECSVCSSGGFSCTLCKSEEVLYPFDNRCRQCPKCHSIFHRNCYSEMSTCPKCCRTRSHKKQTD